MEETYEKLRRLRRSQSNGGNGAHETHKLPRKVPGTPHSMLSTTYCSLHTINVLDGILISMMGTGILYPYSCPASNGSQLSCNNMEHRSSAVMNLNTYHLVDSMDSRLM